MFLGDSALRRARGPPRGGGGNGDGDREGVRRGESLRLSLSWKRRAIQFLKESTCSSQSLGFSMNVEEGAGRRRDIDILPTYQVYAELLGGGAIGKRGEGDLLGL